MKKIKGFFFVDVCVCEYNFILLIKKLVCMLLLQVEKVNIYVFYQVYSLILFAYHHGSTHLHETIISDTSYVCYYIFYIWLDNKFLPMRFIFWTKALFQVSVSQD